MTSREWQDLDPNVRKIVERHQEAIPVRLADLSRSFGVPIKAATLAPGISGEIRPDGAGGFLIRVNRHDAPNRQRFTVAHELAHFFLHRDQIGEGIADDVLYRSGLSNWREQQANRLAADILIPQQLLRDEISVNDISAIDFVSRLAERFGVSEETMRIKIEQATS